MKKIDSYLIRSFVPPFVATFFIALFVLILQILWVYIDDIIGKGSSLLFILEMVFYLSMTLIPLALPIAVLISSVMVLGNLAERYELSSLKSAGVSLSRIMAPLLVIVVGIALFSFVCSNYLIPIANLKGKTRLYDVRKQKPNLNLEAGMFNEDFEGYVIYVGSKSDDGREINDVMVYSNNNSRLFQVITAEKGQLYTTPDQRYLVMELENGRQYQELQEEGQKESQAFLRSEFSKWEKLFDLGQFNLERTDEGSFRTNATVLTIPQIQEARDSVIRLKLERNDALKVQLKPYLPPPFYKDSLPNKDKLRAVPSSFADSIPRETVYNAGLSGGYVPQDSSLLVGTGISSILETYPQKDQNMLIGRARTFARTVHGEALSANRVQKEYNKTLSKYSLEIHLKFSLAVICIIFLFIGAPMGAIVRKGGFGYPILIAICFFMMFMILNMLFKSLAEKLIISPALGAWAPCLIMFPLGFWLTYRAMIDARIIETESFTGPIVRFVNLIRFRYGKKRPSTS